MHINLEEYYDLDGNLLARYENDVRVFGSGVLDVDHTFFSAQYLASPDGRQLTSYADLVRFRLLPNEDKALLRALVEEHGPYAFVHDDTFMEVMQ